MVVGARAREAHQVVGGSVPGRELPDVGKDLLCRDGFTAAGGVRLRRTEARKSVQFVDATLVDRPGSSNPTPRYARYALNAYGLATPELRVLLAALKSQMAGGGSLRLVNVTPAVSRVFEMTGLRNLMADVG